MTQSTFRTAPNPFFRGPISSPPFFPHCLQAWVCALLSAVGTLLLEGALMVLRMSRADALERAEKAAREAARGKVVAAPVDPLLGCEGGVVAGEFDTDKEKAE